MLMRAGKLSQGPLIHPPISSSVERKFASLFDPFENTFTSFQLKGVLAVLFVRENVG